MSLFDLLFPKKCAGCGTLGTYFCVNCIRDSQKPIQQICPVCKKVSLDGVSHSKCRRNYLPDGLFVIWNYTGVPKKLIIKLKYKFVAEIAFTLASCTYGVLTSYQRSIPQAINWQLKDVVFVPIPLSHKRTNWRGFNQSEEIAKIIAKMAGWETVMLLKREKNTLSQVGLTKAEREKNVEQAFVVVENIVNYADRTIVLFDDVWTTGSTMFEAARVLKNAGCKKVWCLTLAK